VRAGVLRADQVQLLGGVARGGGLRGPFLALPQPGHRVGQGGQLGE
jgi:hypothetical protein